MDGRFSIVPRAENNADDCTPPAISHCDKNHSSSNRDISAVQARAEKCAVAAFGIVWDWGANMRWILLLLAVFGFGLAFASKTPGLLSIGLLLGFGGLFGSLFGFAAERIASTARPDATLLTDRDINVLRASMRKPIPPPPANMPSTDMSSTSSG